MGALAPWDDVAVAGGEHLRQVRLVPKSSLRAEVI